VHDDHTVGDQLVAASAVFGDIAEAALEAPPPKLGVFQEVFNLDEGPVTLTFPSTLSTESYQDLEDHIAIFLRKAKRRAQIATA
jgi:hypothetical protein